jgi:hypothetical protein
MSREINLKMYLTGSVSEVLDSVHKAQDWILIDECCKHCNEPSDPKKGKELLDLLRI